MHRILQVVFGTLLLAGFVSAVPASPKGQATLQCTLTGKKIESCCCEVRQGKLYCPLAKKTIDTCCCKPIRS